jgi:hypothetical protein
VTGGMRTCACGCGRCFEVPGMGRPRKFFDGACRIRAWRANSAPKAAAVTEVQALPLTFENRQALRAEISRRRQIAVRDEARRQAALDAQLAEEASA